MIRVANEGELRTAGKNLLSKDKGGATRRVSRFELEYGYYVVEVENVPAGQSWKEAEAVTILAPGEPYTDHYTAHHAAVTIHGMEPADGAVADEQDRLPW